MWKDLVRKIRYHNKYPGIIRGYIFYDDYEPLKEWVAHEIRDLLRKLMKYENILDQHFAKIDLTIPQNSELHQLFKIIMGYFHCYDCLLKGYVEIYDARDLENTYFSDALVRMRKKVKTFQDPVVVSEGVEMINLLSSESQIGVDK